MEIPLRAGRDMARLVEVAAMVQAARQLGHDSANDFNEKLLKKSINRAEIDSLYRKILF